VRVRRTDPDQAVEGEVLSQVDLPDAAEDGMRDTLRPEAAHRGPTAVANDPWDFDPDVELADEAYHGRRRADAPAVRRWMVIALVLAGLGAAVAIPVALWSSRDGAVAPLTGRPSDTANDRVVPGPGGSASGASSPSPVVSPSASVAAAPPAKPFVPVTYEAEASQPANTRSGSARVRNVHGASGKKIVNRIGDWTDSDLTEASNGTLSFNNVTAPVEGTYTLTVFYAFLEDDPSRTALITVNETAPRNVSFARPDGCCPSSTRISIRLTKGVNTILFSNSASRAPAVDKIVIGRP